MRRKKFMRMMCGLMSGIMVCSFGNVAFAADTEINMENPEEHRVIVDGVDITIDIEEEIYRAEHGITDVDISDVMTLSAEATTESEMPVEVYTTTRRIDAPTLTVDGSEIYATTSVATVYANEKSSYDDETEDYVKAYGTIYWRDNPGISNEFISASGGWTPLVNPSTGQKPTVSDRMVRIEATDNTASSSTYYRYYPTINSFYVGSSQGIRTAWKYILTLRARVNSNSRYFIFDIKTSTFD